MFVGPILAVSLIAAGGSASAALAQDASPVPTTGSPIVGAWLLDLGNDPTTTAPTTAIFHGDGTYIQTDGTETGIGSWVATGPSTGDLTMTEYRVEPTGEVSSATVRGSIEVGPDGTMTGTFSLEYGGVAGTPSGQFGPGTVTATRVAIEPMASDLIPMGPPPSAAPASATP